MAFVKDDIVGCVLAGGLSRRMGSVEKATVMLANRPLISFALEGLQQQTSVQIINANGDKGRFDRFGLPVVADDIEGFAGPLAGVHAGLCWMRDHMPARQALVSVACDTPFFPDQLVGRFCENHFHDEAIIIASS